MSHVFLLFSAGPKGPAVTTMDFLDPGSHDSSGTATPTQMTFTTHVKHEKNHVPKLAFVSAQLEKVKTVVFNSSCKCWSMH